MGLHSFIHSANIVEHLLEARNWGGIAHRVLRCDLTLNKNSKDLYNSAHIMYQEFLSAFGTSHSNLQCKCLTEELLIFSFYGIKGRHREG